LTFLLNQIDQQISMQSLPKDTFSIDWKQS